MQMHFSVVVDGVGVGIVVDDDDGFIKNQNAFSLIELNCEMLFFESMECLMENYKCRRI